eukprot:6487367-Amphidinium_carterae.1
MQESSPALPSTCGTSCSSHSTLPGTWGGGWDQRFENLNNKGLRPVCPPMGSSEPCGIALQTALLTKA